MGRKLTVADILSLVSGLVLVALAGGAAIAVLDGALEAMPGLQPR